MALKDELKRQECINSLVALRSESKAIGPQVQARCVDLITRFTALKNHEAALADPDLSAGIDQEIADFVAEVDAVHAQIKATLN